MKKTLTIRTRLFVGFLSMAAIAVVISVVSLLSLASTTHAFSRYVHGIDARAQVAAEVRAAVDRRAIAARNLVLVTTQADLDLETEAVKRAHADVGIKLKQLNDMINSATDTSETARSLVAEMNRVEGLYGPVALNIVGLALDKHHDEAIKEMDEHCRPLLAALVKATDDYATYTKTRQDEIVQNFEDRYAMLRNVILGVSALAILASIVLAVRMVRSITQPITRAVQVARTVAKGDLTSRIIVDRDDEAGELLKALRDMNERLTETVGRVRMSSASVSSATTEIATGNSDLSRRTEAQAASLQETAASMEQLTSTVKQNSDNAQHAKSLASNASVISQRGSETVERVVTTMEAISASSGKIADITGIIEGISFQTNILALNAAVEAARAGEEGRGFAVVAGEVRSLAQRSAQAAKEIKELIARSVQEVQSGASLADDAGQTMADVKQAVARVSEIVEEIAAASAEQGRGIEQINLAITQMDTVTQQNAALVEQASAASQSLRDQGRELDDTVSAFRLAAA
ncbi:HAMP domain-containing protein [Paraburkholderia sp. Tr-20389]|uniref:methyl-accepting chemotaxis protein n=1 Tax=Paraburkholderia sp. Tr-20389 TaxID=2703903 RepID=UPI001981A1A9|nr:HAMP domain-containing protein [Paraburkholderia sp. Tr-20389]